MPHHDTQIWTFLRFGQEPNVIFEIFNEPIYQSWNETIKPYHEKIVSVIREHSSNLIILGTGIWSQDVDIAAEDPAPRLAKTAKTVVEFVKLMKLAGCGGESGIHDPFLCEHSQAGALRKPMCRLRAILAQNDDMNITVTEIKENKGYSYPIFVRYFHLLFLCLVVRVIAGALHFRVLNSSKPIYHGQELMAAPQHDCWLMT